MCSRAEACSSMCRPRPRPNRRRPRSSDPPNPRSSFRRSHNCGRYLATARLQVPASLDFHHAKSQPMRTSRPPRRRTEATTSTPSSSTPTNRARSTRSMRSRCASPTSRSSPEKKFSDSRPRGMSCAGFSLSASRWITALSSGTSISSRRGPSSRRISPSTPTGVATSSSFTATPTRTWPPSCGTTPKTSLRGSKSKPRSLQGKRRMRRLSPATTASTAATRWRSSRVIQPGHRSKHSTMAEGRSFDSRRPWCCGKRRRSLSFAIPETELVNYRVKNDTYVIDRLIDAAELRVGQKDQEIVRVVRGQTETRTATLGKGR